MSTLQTKEDVTAQAVRQALSEALGSTYSVGVKSESTVSVGRTGVIPAHVKISRSNGITTFRVTTTGLILSRIMQAVTINPRVRKALAQAFPKASPPA